MCIFIAAIQKIWHYPKNSDNKIRLKISRRMKKIEALSPAKHKILLQNIDMFIKGADKKDKAVKA